MRWSGADLRRVKTSEGTLQMIVYGTGYSPYVRKVLVSLIEKGAAYEHVPCMFHADDPAFKAASPLGKIPAMDDDGFTLADSTAIQLYLERKHPSPALVPTEARALGRAMWFDEFGDTELFAKLIVPFRERVLKPTMMGKPCDDAAVAQALDTDLPPLFDYLESQVDGPYLVGGAFSIADISIAAGFYNFHLAEARIDAGRWPKFAAYIDGILARPSFAEAHEARKG